MDRLNYRIIIEYDGSDYVGWQRQKKHSNTIQEVLENALFTILRTEIKLTGAGRTDAGVHAYNQTANFKTAANIDDTEKFLYSLNSIVPESITIKSIEKVDDAFHSRYSAVEREYIYRITTNNISIGRKYYFKLNYALDFNIIDEFIKIICGYNSFKSFCKNHSDKHGFRCNLKQIKYVYDKKNGKLEFVISSDRFLHSMVRAVIGCLIDLGRGRLEIEETKEKFSKGDKIKATYLPANGLFLNKIYY
ncbi:MAG: tRNA pseudouridine(38-40) synthase TruA [Ignavibacteria bacterium]|nr:tRNA pseudouridine(38-40) synthase TruA [Ignavibacteria bacterium]